MHQHRGGLVTLVGLGTFVHPRHSGGWVNASSRRALVELLKIEGDDYFLYKVFPTNDGLLRGTTAENKAT